MQSKPKTQSSPLDINAENLGKLAHALDIRTYNTPKLFQTSMFAIWGLSLIWIPTTIGAIQNQRNSIKTIAKDAIPSVILAQRIIDAMSDMDTMVASELLGEVPKSQNKTQDKIQEPAPPLLIQVAPWEKLPKELTPFTRRRNDLAERLTKAAANSTFPGEDKAVQQLTLYAGDYFAYADRAQAAHNQGNRAEALKQYKLAAQVLDAKFIPVAHKLRDINTNKLGDQYNDFRNQGSHTTTGVLLLGTLTIAALVALQLFLFIRTRRTLNPMLLGATLVAFLFLLHSIVTLTTTGEQLRVLKEDSYNSLLEFRLARELLYGANSDESRYLLDTNNRQEHEDAFQRKTARIFGESDNQAALERAIGNLKSKQKDSATGHFAKSFNNITFPDERRHLTEMLEQYKVYMAIDQDIRTYVANKNLPAATALCLGQSNEVFLKVKKGMDDAKDVNQAFFDNSEASAMGQLNGFEIKATIALGAMATLVFFGLRPRMREYL